MSLATLLTYIRCKNYFIQVVTNNQVVYLAISSTAIVTIFSRISQESFEDRSTVASGPSLGCLLDLVYA